MLHGPYRSRGLFPVRYTVLALCMASSVLGLIAALAWGCARYLALLASIG